MRLSDFIRKATAEIVEESVKFARTMPVMADQRIDVQVLSNHLPLVLSAIATDLDRPQTAAEAIRKSEGAGPVLPGETAAQTHGRMRAEIGLNVAQVVAEYRVLRAVVTRLWTAAGGLTEARAAQELIRFNEAIDQAIAESVAFHSAEIARWRNTLLATIGHDLRSPLSTVTLASEVLSLQFHDGSLVPAIDLIKRGAQRLGALLDSLLEYNNAELGKPMRLCKTDVDLGRACRAELDLLRTTLPGVEIAYTTSGSLAGRFDENRVREALANLVSNAAQYRKAGTPIRVSAEDNGDAVTVAVVNHGDAIPHETLESFFAPLRRSNDSNHAGSRRNLGIGLFIVREIARAHGGDATAESSDGMISFALRLPKCDPQNQADVRAASSRPSN